MHVYAQWEQLTVMSYCYCSTAMAASICISGMRRDSMVIIHDDVSDARESPSDMVSTHKAPRIEAGDATWKVA